MRNLAKLAALSCALFVTTGGFAQEFLAIPNSSVDGVWKFSPVDGSLISNNFIADPARLSTPKNAILSNRGTVFVSEQLDDAIYEYDLNGNFVGTIADDTDGIENVRGITIRNDVLYATLGSSSSAVGESVQAIDLNTGVQTTWSESLIDGFDITFRGNDALVSDIDNEDIVSFNFTGGVNGLFFDGDGVNALDFPQQVALAANGNVLVAGFSSPSGIYEFDSDGGLINYFDVGAIRGVYELQDGNILFTSGNGVFRYNRADNIVETVVDGDSFQYIELVPEPASLSLLALSGLFLIRRR